MSPRWMRTHEFVEPRSPLNMECRTSASRSLRVINICLVAVVGIFLSSLDATAASSGPGLPPSSYALGQGWFFPQYDLRLGGYTDIKYYQIDHGKRALSVEDASLFVTKDWGSRWRFFTETELTDALNSEGNGVTMTDARIDVERLYLDYRLFDSATLRFGKFLTPIGQWNLTHADPLVWTSVRPLTTESSFASHANGAMIYGTLNVDSNDLDYWLFVDDSAAIGIDTTNDAAFGAYGATNKLKNSFAHAVGGQLLYHMWNGHLSIGGSAATFTMELPNISYSLLGLDIDWSDRFGDVSGEAIRRTSHSPGYPDDYGGYLQGVLNLPSRFFLVGRIERYKSAAVTGRITLRTVGVNYRPSAGVVVKVERVDGTNSRTVSPSGWFASFGLLF